MLPGPLRLQDTFPVASLRAAVKLCAELPAVTVALLGETVSEGVDAGEDDPQAPRRRRVATTAMDNRIGMVRASRSRTAAPRRQTQGKPHRVDRDAFRWRGEGAEPGTTPC